MYIKNYHQVNKKVAMASTFILIILSASIISELLWKVLEKKHDANNPIAATIPSNIESMLMPNNLFGMLDSTNNQQQHNNIKSTRLNLTLIGILSQNQQSLAIIRQGGGKDKIYKLNDFIDSSTMIKEVHAKYVILSRNGNLEKLTIKRNKIDFTKSKKIHEKSPINTVSKSKLLGYLKQLDTNPKKLLSIVSVKPNYTKNGMHGFIISPGIERKLFSELGFQKNDIIVSINNTELTNLSQAIKLRKELSKQQYFDFTIQRNGQTLPLSINLNQ